jgi:hypothetical protein
MSTLQCILAHLPLAAYIKPHRSILSKVRDSIKIEIVNNCDGITLGSGTCIILEGHYKHDFKDTLPPFESLSTMIRSKGSIDRTKCCIVYELLDSENPTTPLWWEYRVFLAVCVSTSPFSDENKATAILFKIKDREFNGVKQDIDYLHVGILQYSMCRPLRAATWNLNGQALSLNPRFDFYVPASVRVVLERSHLSIEHDPIFHRTGKFA